MKSDDINLDKKIFTATLKGAKNILLEKDQKVIVPLQPYKNPMRFSRDMRSLADVQGDGLRGVVHPHPVSSLRLKNGKEPFLLFVSQHSFRLLDGWTIYRPSMKNIQFGGWCEIDADNKLQATFSYFVPIGPYGDDASLVLLREVDNEVIEDVFLLRDFVSSREEDQSKPQPRYDVLPGLVAETTAVKAIYYRHASVMKRGTVAEIDLCARMGITKDLFSNDGRVITFSAAYSE